MDYRKIDAIVLADNVETERMKNKTNRGDLSLMERMAEWIIITFIITKYRIFCVSA